MSKEICLRNAVENVAEALKNASSKDVEAGISGKITFAECRDTRDGDRICRIVQLDLGGNMKVEKEK
ncbi:MAG: hypothetical protein PHS80_07395 [Methanothrix sp.]|nr:hypothetical protein [Methanothrix sp.]MDD4446894.1 hypothetical protein [Methanothrix sp.]